MKHASMQTIFQPLAMALLCLLVGTSPASGQAAKPASTAQQTKPLMSDELFKNVQVLKGIPVDQFMGTMGFIAASLSVNCTECHTARDYSFDTPKKKTARQMMLMMNSINKDNFGGARMVTCYTCHRSDTTPRVTPSLAEQYGMPPDPDPNDVGILAQPDPKAATAEQILDKYIEAIGGKQKLAGLTSFTAKGTYSGYDTDLGDVPAEFYANAPNQRAVIAHRPNAENMTVFDGHNGWIAMTNTRLPLYQLSGGALDGAQLDAEISFPAGMKQELTRLRVGFPPVTVDDHDVQVVQGTAPNGTIVKLFFDTKSGLLLRMARFAATAIGFNPTQVDFSDYRDVAGVKVPFHWSVSWTDGKSEFQMTDVQPNVSIDPAKFAKPDVPETLAAPPGQPAPN